VQDHHQPDGTVEIDIGSQDLGVGTRTIIAQVAAETSGCRTPRSR
jgi:CO/xanthine dehydrogenase Mo-binding subunit